MHIDHIQNGDYNTHLYPSPGQFEFITNFKLKLKYKICFTCRNYMYFTIWSSFLLRESYFCRKQKKYEFGSIKKVFQSFEFGIIKTYPEKFEFDDIFFYFKR